MFEMKETCNLFLRNMNGEYLFQLRDNHVSDGGKWSLFGGGIEPGETPEEGVKREVKEEINFDLKDAKLILEYTNSLGSHAYLFFSIIDKDINELTLKEGKDFGFFSIEDSKNIGCSEIVKKYLPIVEEYFQSTFKN